MKNATVRARPKVLDERTRPATVQIMQMGNVWQVERRRVGKLGFTARVAAEKRADFAELLHQLGQILASKAANIELPTQGLDDADTILQFLAPALQLHEDDFIINDPDGMPVHIRDEMCERGMYLYRELSDSMRDALQRKRIGIDIETPSANPGVTFVIDETTEESQYPIFWNMLYQPGDSENPGIAESNWRHFWGFLMPITQWLYESDATAEIDLASALLSFSEDDDLRYSEIERQFLALHFPGEHSDFGKKLYEVAQTLIATSQGHESPAVLPNQEACPNWLEELLNALYPEQNQRFINSKKWKANALKYVFAKNTRYGLVHFACHCRSKKAARRVLDLSIGGEPITIDEELLLNHLTRSLSSDPDTDLRGPLVFLNACSTAAADFNSLAELPVGWIRTQNAKAVIATICDMPDVFAYAFAVKFYSTLIGAVKTSKEYWRQNRDTMRRLPEQDVVEALLETRLYFLDTFNNPLGLAYELYAVPDAFVTPSL